uniref:Uncharacterized protein n=1 Tax=Anguilla anguilla TaxID=7936 RepID=A0A0E9QT54_ANGAN
MGLISVFLRN